jgi:hypothetical protein
MKIGIVGSRTLLDYELVKKALAEYLSKNDDLIIVSGGAAGADSLGERFANENGLHYPAPSEITMIGDEWINSHQSIALKVPSCIVPSASNYVLNCSHTDYGKVKIIDISPFKIDNRLM